jgi:hypothetical protein
LLQQLSRPQESLIFKKQLTYLLRNPLFNATKLISAGANNPIFSSSGGVIRRTVADPPSPAEHRVVYAHASDRYFERRPRSPQAGTSNPNGDYRRS